MTIKFFLLFIFVAFSSLSAYEDRCFRDIEDSFFNERFVFEAMSLRNVYQSQWTPIYSMLRDRARSVRSIVQKKARNITPNPLSPYDKKEAAAVLKQTLYDVFADVMRYYGIGEIDIRGMFKYISDQQRGRLRACFGEEAIEAW